MNINMINQNINQQQKWMKNFDVENVKEKLVKNLKYAFENNLFDVVKKTFDSLVWSDKNGLLSCRDYLVDSDGCSPLFWACNVGDMRMVKLLLEEYRFPLNCQSMDGKTALVVAVLGGYGDVVSYLLAKGANPNMCNLKKESPLHMACCLNEIEMCEMLIKNGAWIEAEDENGETPLYWAVREDHIEVCELLLINGANPDHPNEDDDTPKDMAKLSSSQNIIDLFESFGDDPKFSPLPPKINIIQSNPFKTMAIPGQNKLNIISSKIPLHEYNYSLVF